MTACEACPRDSGNNKPVTNLVWGESVGGTVTTKGFAWSGASTYYYIRELHPINQEISLSSTNDMTSHLHTPAGSQVGWVFAPGSQVVLQSIGGNSTYVDRYSIIGYLSRE
jgi:hypothetical protein